MKTERKARWADLEEEFSNEELYESSTQSDRTSHIVPTSTGNHPEIQLLRSKLSSFSPPVRINFGNLSYAIECESVLVRYFQLTKEKEADVNISLLRSDNQKSLGRATAVVQNLELAYKIIDFHGTLFMNRPIFMNLDGFFGRGEQHKKALGMKKRKPFFNKALQNKNKKNYRGNYSRK